MDGQQRLSIAGRTLLAIIELVVLLVVAGQFMRWGMSVLGLDSYREVAAAWKEGDEVPWMRLAVHDTIRHGLRYGPLFPIAFVWGYYAFRFRSRDYGLTLSDIPLWVHAAWGVGVFAFIGLPTKLLIAYLQDAGMGEGAAHWTMLESGSGLGFWMFMAASSFILPPIFEELYFRGYAQTRLGSVIGMVPAVLTISLLFAAAHTQYYSLEITSLTMLVCIFISAAANGLVRHATGSLIAPVVAHILVNVPWSG